MTDYNETEARARFATFGPALGAEAALAAAQAGAVVMSYGYGEGPMDPDGFSGIEADELAEAIELDGVETVDADWGPFAVWTVAGRCGECDAVLADDGSCDVHDIA